MGIRKWKAYAHDLYPLLNDNTKLRCDVFLINKIRPVGACTDFGVTVENLSDTVYWINFWIVVTFLSRYANELRHAGLNMIFRKFMPDHHSITPCKHALPRVPGDTASCRWVINSIISHISDLENDCCCRKPPRCLSGIHLLIADNIRLPDGCSIARVLDDVSQS